MFKLHMYEGKEIREDDAQMLLDEFPDRVPNIGEHLEANAYVCLNTKYDPPRLEIWPKYGGWLGIESNVLQGDIAPWHG